MTERQSDRMSEIKNDGLNQTKPNQKEVIFKITGPHSVSLLIVSDRQAQEVIKLVVFWLALLDDLFSAMFSQRRDKL